MLQEGEGEGGESARVKGGDMRLCVEECVCKCDLMIEMSVHTIYLSWSKNFVHTSH